MTETTTTEAATLMGRMGGNKTKERHGVEFFRTISKKGTDARWHKKKEKKDTSIG